MKALLFTSSILVLLTSCAELEETGRKLNQLKSIGDPERIPFPTEFRATPPELIPIPDQDIPDPETPPL